MHNVSENDARTNYYGVYGGTPRLVIQGVVLSSSASFADPAIFTSVAGQTSSFAMRVAIAAKGTDSVAVRAVVTKEDTSSLASLNLYGVLAEDTIFVAAANGEPQSYDVFRKALWGALPVSIATPTAVGDSVVHTATVAVHAAWGRQHIYALVLAQDGGKQLVQAARSGNLPAAAGMPHMPQTGTFAIMPNPARVQAQIAGLSRYPAAVAIYNMAGRLCRQVTLPDAGATLPLADLPRGSYLVFAHEARGALLLTLE